MANCSFRGHGLKFFDISAFAVLAGYSAAHVNASLWTVASNTRAHVLALEVSSGLTVGGVGTF